MGRFAPEPSASSEHEQPRWRWVPIRHLVPAEGDRFRVRQWLGKGAYEECVAVWTINRWGRGRWEDSRGDPVFPTEFAVAAKEEDKVNGHALRPDGHLGEHGPDAS